MLLTGTRRMTLLVCSWLVLLLPCFSVPSSDPLQIHWEEEKFCLLYCVLYVTSCITKHFSSYIVLMFGRFLGGIATSLLFSVFESWFVCAHNNNGFATNLMGQVFSQQIFLNSVVAILSGVLAQLVASYPRQGGPNFFYAGYTGPFDLAIVSLVVGGVFILFNWSENYGERKTFSFSLDSLVAPSLFIVRNRTVLVLGLIQSLFEGSMYAFVFEWTPALLLPLNKEESLPYGIIFATFMVCCMAGSQVVVIILKYGSPKTTLVWTFFISACSLSTVLLDQYFGTSVKIYGFFFFEICVGIYYPLMSMLKSQIVPEEHRSAIYNIFRVPLNAIVLFLLLKNFSVVVTFAYCCSFLVVACFLQIFLCRVVSS
eukprot:TRINITY_DN9362_c0_g1_i1.p1 TRINITY_DN9362_c0_g1~~TRINITY_DN9362_c0_g1_i1.p1  ORF type:complete len:370 (-),score=39.12 TRINITY_DN9362_c0_g1_i1:190-1299(-)